MTTKVDGGFPLETRQDARSICAPMPLFGKTKACPQLSQMIAAARWMMARKFLAVLS
jgi:hypothetical protein